MGDRWDPDDEAIRVAIEARLDEAFRTAMLILGDRAAAEDAVADAMLRAWSGRRRLRDTGLAERWFLRIVVNVCRTELRRRSRRLATALDENVVALLPDAAWRSDDRDEIERALARLSPDERVVVALRFGLQLSVPQIADRLEIPEGTAKSRLHYALEHLRAAIEADRRTGRAVG
jgi:RNA polymerase sigma-70 factor (ECF subfamily)